MAAIITRRSWTRQPLQFAGANWSHLYGARLQFLWVAPNGIDVAGGAQIALNAGAAYADSGVALHAGAGNHYGVSVAAGPQSGTQTWLVLVQGPVIGSPYYAGSLIAYDIGAGGEDAGIGVYPTENSVFGASSYSYYGPRIAGELRASNLSLITFSNDPANGAYVTIAGEGSISSGAVNAYPANLALRRIGSSVSNPSYCGYINVVGAAMLSGTLSASEQALLRVADFWGLFRPRTRRLYFGAAAGGGSVGTLKASRGVPRASIKTINGIAVASVKALDGLTL